MAKCDEINSMHENSASSDYCVTVCSPSDLSGAELEECISIVKSGGAVDLKYARKELPLSSSLAVVRIGNRIAALGAIKRIRNSYASGIAGKSAASFPSDTPELGYVAVDSGHQRKGLSHRIVGALLSKYGGPLFATTSSAAMKKTLQKAGFLPQVCEWTGNSGNQLSLWLRGVGSQG
jgi:hypothetical protein